MRLDRVLQTYRSASVDLRGTQMWGLLCMCMLKMWARSSQVYQQTNCGYSGRSKTKWRHCAKRGSSSVGSAPQKVGRVSSFTREVSCVSEHRPSLQSRKERYERAKVSGWRISTRHECFFSGLAPSWLWMYAGTWPELGSLFRISLAWIE